MKTSQFQFSNPVLLNVEFSINPKFKSVENREININVSCNVKVNRNEEKPTAVVELEVMIGSKEDENVPFWIKATEAAEFKWQQDVERPERLLNQNAPAMLLSYLRPTIAMITSASPFNGYNLPFINFTQDKGR